MNHILDTIVARLRPEVERQKRLHPLDAADLPPIPSFRGAFPGVIAELKQASPSKGLIRADFQPVPLALELEAAGAAALSVLTEPNYFLGSLEYLTAVTDRVKLPVLRKEFIFDPYQILEARRSGAAAVLLIAALLPQAELLRLAEYALRLGMDVLGEAHNAEEVARLLDSPVTLIGVNARDLRTFATDLGGVAELLKPIPPERLPIAESAITSAADLRRLREAGAQGFLIGETLMRAPSPGAKLRELLA